MKRLGCKITGFLTGILIVGSGIALVAQEESSDIAPETSSEIPYEQQILRYGLEQLNYFKRALPELHAEVTSPDWMELGGSEKLRIVVKSVPKEWGATDEDVEDYIRRFDQYESIVPIDSRENFEMILGGTGEFLLTHVYLMDQGKESIQALVEVHEILWDDEDPSKLAEYEKCLNQTHAAMGTNTKSAFVDWLDRVEKITPSAEMMVPHVKLKGDFTRELVRVTTTEQLEAQRKCGPDWETDS